MKEIIFFSNNKNKIQEISNLFIKFNYKLLSLNDFKNTASPIENGKTFKDNAKIKSIYGYKKFNRLCFADDSGICIDALNGAPGINSKQYLETESKKNIVLNKIISLAKNKDKYKAFFQTSICLTLNINKQIFFTGRVCGKISLKIKGNHGFGYDPIFIPNGTNLTFSEMSLYQKNLLSHRAIAIKKLSKYLTNSV
ncbi:RdgB/HAM1 family non-canonical purine NTP pyrophosphatase [Alphaproteobacteria bacterium]|nr:RdgB/HAM1 family non-canonical purine NTP pyrophosphatase [Alphaproteobacteria bacterium]